MRILLFTNTIVFYRFDNVFEKLMKEKDYIYIIYFIIIYYYILYIIYFTKKKKRDYYLFA